MSNEALLTKIANSDKLPMLPDVAMRIVELRNDDEVYPSKVASVMSSDPMLAAKMLSIANSSMFPFRRQIVDLNEAIAILGVDLAMNIAIGFAIVDMMRHREHRNGIDYDRFWRKSVLGAVLAFEMHGRLSGTSAGDLFMTALLQDIGILALEDIAGEQYSQLYNRCRDHQTLIAQERKALGIDHTEVGIALIRRWELPEVYELAISHSHDLYALKAINQMDDLCYGVALSGTLAEQWMEDSDDRELSRHIHKALDRIGEHGQQQLVEKTLAAIPSTGEVFKLNILKPEQIDALSAQIN